MAGKWEGAIRWLDGLEAKGVSGSPVDKFSYYVKLLGKYSNSKFGGEKR